MKKRALANMLASAAVLGSAIAGCSGGNAGPRASLTTADVPALALRVEKALGAKDYARALMDGEALVAAQPGDPAYRALLGRAYLANGRYASARTAFTDAMTLGNRDVRTIVSLALAQTGLGDAPAARALLVAHIADLPAADYGLAMAMAGDPREGVRALVEAVRQPDASAQTRQNLAYALALAGAWGQARLIAGQDLSAREAEARMRQWSQASLASDERGRVVAMIGVAPHADDAGLPERLALNSAPAPVEMAAAEAPKAQMRVDAPADATPASPAITLVEVEQASIPAPQALTREAAHAAFDRAAIKPEPRAADAATPGPVSATGPVADGQASDWVVQLGAFDSLAVARASWQTISRDMPDIARFPQIHSHVALNGRAFHRLAIRGFADREAAEAVCRSLRAGARGCFVRLDDSGTVRMARAKAKAEVVVRKLAAGRSLAAR
jgi:Flp pilus assembly protein TadD